MKKVYKTLLDAMIVMANKGNPTDKRIIKNDNGWYEIVKKA